MAIDLLDYERAGFHHKDEWQDGAPEEQRSQHHHDFRKYFHDLPLLLNRFWLPGWWR
jgi:hypothetical protein